MVGAASLGLQKWDGLSPSRMYRKALCCAWAAPHSKDCVYFQMETFIISSKGIGRPRRLILGMMHPAVCSTPTPTAKPFADKETPMCWSTRKTPGFRSRLAH